MSHARRPAVVRRVLAAARRTRTAWRRGLAALQADRPATALFLGSVAFYGLYLRVDVFIVDTFAVANTASALAGGRLAVDPLAFGPSDVRLPGLHAVDERLYGRNYGHAAAAVPLLWALRALSAVVEIRVLLAGLWSLCVLGAAVQVGRVVGRERVGSLAGSALALALLGANLGGRGLPRESLSLLSLQLTTVLTAALLAVVAYRLLPVVEGLVYP